MFSIGGVSALKSHAFFEFVDWNALERLQVTPPFNFTPSAANRCPGAAPDKSVLVQSATPKDDDNFALQFFDAEFTNQQLSLSMLEDTLQSPNGGATPMRSGAVSRDEGSTEDTADPFSDFEYMKDSLGYTAEQVTEFHSLLQAKMVKAQKKKALKQKKEEKGTVEAAKRQAALEVAAQQALEVERARKEQAERQARTKAQLALKQERIKRHREQQMKIDEHNAKVTAYLEKLSVQQKKLKALRKKQRDVTETQEKIAALKKADKSYKVTKEQQQKLDRLEQIEEEIEEVEAAEKEVLATCPGELLPNAVLEEDPEPEAEPQPLGIDKLTPVISLVLQAPLLPTLSSENLMESATTMEVSYRDRTGAASHTPSTIVISQVPLTEKGPAGDVATAGGGKAHGLHVGSSSPGSVGDSQFTTPFSFSPVHARSAEAEPRRSFWGAATSSTASDGAKPAPLSAAMDAENWRAKKPVVANLSSASTGTTTIASGNRVAAAAPMADKAATWRSPSAAVAAATGATSASSVGGWSKAPIAANTTMPLKASAPAPAPVAAKPKPAAADEWVTTAPKKKANK